MPNNKNIEEILEEFEKQFPEITEKIESLHRPGTMHERYIETGRRSINLSPIKNFIKQSLLTLQSKHEEEIKRIAKDVNKGKIEMLQNFRGVMGMYNCSSDCVVSKKFSELIEKEIESLKN